MKWIFILLVFVSSFSFGQTDDPAKYLRYQNQYGQRLPRHWSDSVLRAAGLVKFTGITQQTDTTTYKPIAIDGSGNVHKFDRWPGGGLNGDAIQDSITDAFKLADSLPGAGSILDKTWALVSKQRPFQLIDENFIHYISSFNAGHIADLTTISGTNPTPTSGGQLAVNANSFLKTSTGPKAAWFSVELDLESISVGSTGTASLIGPALIKDASNYVAAVYDSKAGKTQILVNGAVVFQKTLASLTSGIIYLAATGNALNMWIKSGGRTYFCGTANCSFDLLAPGVISQYKYGLIAFADGTTTNHTVNSLRGGVSGGSGVINVRAVTNEDGSPYVYGNKMLFTADYTSWGRGNFNFAYENSTVFAMDIENYAIETVGRLYFHRGNSTAPSYKRTYGGADIKLSWYESRKKWLLNYVWSDYDSSYATHNDSYAWLDYEAAFGETIIEEEQLLDYGFNASVTNLVYDCNVRYINGEWVVIGAETNAAEGAGTWTLVTPIVFRGSDLSTLNTFDRYTTTTFLECAMFIKSGGQWYAQYYGFNKGKAWLFSLPGLDSVGTFVFGTNATSVRIPGYEWVDVQKNDSTAHLLVGFDDVDFTIKDIQDSTWTHDWSLGNWTVYKANQKTNGYVYNNTIQKQIGFPIRKLRVVASSTGTSGSPAGSDGDIQYKNGTSFAGGGPTYNSSNGTLTNPKNQNAGTSIIVSNTNTGANAAAMVTVGDGTDETTIGHSSTGFSGFGVITARSGYINSAADSGITIQSGENNASLRFACGGLVERLRIKHNGFVGIGTNNPSEILHVTRNFDGSSLLLFDNPNSGTSAFVGMQYQSNGGSAYLYRTSNAYSVSALADDFVIQDAGGGDIVFYGAAEVARFKNGGGLQVANLAGSGDRMVVANSSGDLSTQAIPTGITTINSQTGATQTIAGGTGISVNSSSNTHTIAINSGYFQDGRWLPTTTTSTNVTAVTPDSCTYIRQGSRVSYTALFVVDVTAPGSASFYFTIPIASNLAASYDLGGVAGGSTGAAGYSVSDATNDRAQVVFVTTASGEQIIQVTGHYTIFPIGG